MVNFKRILPWVLVVLWMLLIFFQSHKPASESNDLSKGITEKIVDTVEKVNPNTSINKRNFNHILRKNAHFFLYLALSIFILIGLRSIGVSKYRSIGFTLLICILYAISDEIHQIYIPGRGGQAKDVIIDSAGALAGIGIYTFCSYLKKSRK